MCQIAAKHSGGNSGALDKSFPQRFFPCVIFRNFIFPALSSFLVFSPHHDTRWAASSNNDMYVPNSTMTDIADLTYTPGTVCRFPICFGDHSLQSFSIFTRHSSRCFRARATSSIICRMTSMSVRVITPVRAAVITFRPVSNPTEDESSQHLRVCNTLLYLFHNFLIAHAVSGRDIVTDANITSLENCIQLGRYVDALFRSNMRRSYWRSCWIRSSGT